MCRLITETFKNNKQTDPGQLPPVTKDKNDPDAISPIFTLNVKESSKHHLIERVRQKESNPIIELSDIIYDALDGDLGDTVVPKIYHHINKCKNDGEFGYDIVTQRNFLEVFKNSSEDYLDTKVISFRNYAVDNMNKIIRNYLYGNITDQYVIGDVIILNDSYYHTPTAEKPQQDMNWKMYNSDEYKIIRVEKNYFQEILCWDLFINPEGKRHLEGKTNPFIRVVAPEGKPAYRRELERLYLIAQIETDKKLRVLLFKAYHDFKTMFGNISYAYCITAYKAQGSTIKNVFIDINDIIGTKPISRKIKLQTIITALTRATHKATFITSRDL